MPADGRGYTRPASLISAWSTAPFLLNNSVGPFEPDPSVDARMRVFEKSIEQMLWPEKRERDNFLGDQVPGVIDRTTTRSFIRIPVGFQPDFLRNVGGLLSLHELAPRLFDSDGSITIGPIPAGVPVNLLANLQPLPETNDRGDRRQHIGELVKLLVKLKLALLATPANASDADLLKIFADLDLKKSLLALNKCPDFTVNRGHYFGTQLSEEQALGDEDKRALIEFIKTF